MGSRTSGKIEVTSHTLEGEVLDKVLPGVPLVGGLWRP